ncbi:DUF4190 domain-containing protein [Salininema proteolyticum]|uniref:DUF4190 domain-containing protein n=1 Tax=Salininema proteolyticum TaxID=1607685 RepID=A0ABV8TZH4_9ACTN
MSFDPQNDQYAAPEDIDGEAEEFDSAPKQTNAAAITGLVCGICSVVFVCIPLLGFLTSVVAIVSSGIGLSEANKGKAPQRGLAVAGLTVGICALVLIILVLTVVDLLNDLVPPGPV